MQEQRSVPPNSPLPLYLAIRVIGLVLLLPEPVLIGPMHAYLELERLGPAKGLLEYPWPMAVLLELPLRAGATSQPAYVAGWLLVALIMDAAFASLLWRAGGSRMTPGLWLWFLVLPALGPLVLVMSDLVPAVATAAALLSIVFCRYRRLSLCGSIASTRPRNPGVDSARAL